MSGQFKQNIVIMKHLRVKKDLLFLLKNTQKNQNVFRKARNKMHQPQEITNSQAQSSTIETSSPFNPLVLVSMNRLHILKQTCNWKLQVYLSLCNLLVDTRHGRFKISTCKCKFAYHCPQVLTDINTDFSQLLYISRHIQFYLICKAETKCFPLTSRTITYFSFSSIWQQEPMSLFSRLGLIIVSTLFRQQ